MKLSYCIIITKYIERLHIFSRDIVALAKSKCCIADFNLFSVYHFLSLCLVNNLVLKVKFVSDEMIVNTA